MVQELDIKINMNALTALFEKAWTYQAWTNSYPTIQSGLNISIQEPDDYLASCGGGFSLEKEKEYAQLHSFYKNSYLDEIENQLKFSVYRWRWMILFGKSCYSFHQDWSKRIHLPILTTPQSFFVFKDPLEMYQLNVGRAYIVDTTQVHSAMNGSKDWRVHLVGCASS